MSTPSQSPHARMKRLPSEGGGGIAQLSYAYDAEAQKSEDPSMDETDDSLRMRWARIRMCIREPVAEFFGTMLLCIFGCGVNAQVTLSHNAGVSGAPTGDWLSVSFGWACGIAVGVWMCAGISGGHINPAVTITLAVFRNFPWKKVPVFVLAQVLGALTGSALVYANYFRAIGIYEGGSHIRTVTGSHSTAGFFGTYAADYMTNGGAFYNEFLSTAVLVLVILAITDAKNTRLPPGLDPLALFLTLLGIAACLGAETGFALNPARDFGPRLMSFLVGYGREVFDYRGQYWLWCGWLAPITGALTATLLYDLFFFTEEQSIINKARKHTGWQHHHLHAPHGSTHIHIPVAASTT